MPANLSRSTEVEIQRDDINRESKVSTAESASLPLDRSSTVSSHLRKSQSEEMAIETKVTNERPALKTSDENVIGGLSIRSQENSEHTDNTGAVEVHHIPSLAKEEIYLPKHAGNCICL